MTSEFPEFEDYRIVDFPVPLGTVAVSKLILRKYPSERLKERSDTFSYDMTELSAAILFKPRNAPSIVAADSIYVHISPADLLEYDGIRCKSSGRFESYEPRIYLFPLYSMMDTSLPQDKQYDMLMANAKRHADRFNAYYLEHSQIDRPEPYYVYLVDLPGAYDKYDDFSMDEPSVYVLNNIPAKYVRKVGCVEPRKEVIPEEPGI